MAADRAFEQLRSAMRRIRVDALPAPWSSNKQDNQRTSPSTLVEVPWTENQMKDPIHEVDNEDQEPDKTQTSPMTTSSPEKID